MQLIDLLLIVAGLYWSWFLSSESPCFRLLLLLFLDGLCWLDSTPLCHLINSFKVFFLLVLKSCFIVCLNVSRIPLTPYCFSQLIPKWSGDFWVSHNPNKLCENLWRKQNECFCFKKSNQRSLLFEQTPHCEFLHDVTLIFAFFKKSKSAFCLCELVTQRLMIEVHKFR